MISLSFGQGRVDLAMNGSGDLFCSQTVRGLTGSSVDVIQVCIAVLICTAASFAIETGDSRSASAGVLHNHGFTEVFLQLERCIALFHQLGWLRKVVLLTASWFLPWAPGRLTQWKA